MRQCEFKKRYYPDSGKYKKRHIYGEGIITDTIKNLSKKIFGKTMKDVAKKGTKKLVGTTANKTGEFLGNKAGDKIVQLLSRRQNNQHPNIPFVNQQQLPTVKQLTDYEINERVNQLLSGGKLRKMKII